MNRYKKLLALLGSLLLASTLLLHAAEESKEEEKTAKVVESIKKAGERDQAETGMTANALIKKAYAYIGGLKTYRFDATIVNEDDLDGDMMIYLRHHYNVTVQRPSNVRMDVEGDVENRSTYFKDGTVSIIDATKKNYGTVKVSSDIDDTLDDLTEKYGIAIPLTQFLYSDMADEVNASDKGEYLGTVLVDGTACYYLAFPGKEWDVQVWIEKGDKPLIRKAAFVDKMEKGQPRSMITAKWDLNPKIDEKIFDFKAPEGAKKATVLTLEESEKLEKNEVTEAKDKK